MRGRRIAFSLAFSLHVTFRKMNIENKIACVNLVNAEANKLRALITDALADSVGKKVIRFTPYKSWTTKIQKTINEIVADSEANGFRVWFQFSVNWVWLCIDKTYKTGEVSVDYVKQDIFLCNLNGDILVADDRKTCDYRTDYTLAEYDSAQAEIKSLEERLSALKSQIRELLV